VKSSEPYITLFKTEKPDEKLEFQYKMIAFIRQYVEKHEKVNVVIRKIMRMACKKLSMIKTLNKNMPDFV